MSGKLVVDITNIEGQVRFERNEFPYQVESGFHHYVLWMGATVSGALPTEDDINTHITLALQDLTAGDHFDFAWYENPKMTVPLVYHVQVFWRHLPGSFGDEDAT
jgi:hypothetical protein